MNIIERLKYLLFLISIPILFSCNSRTNDPNLPYYMSCVYGVSIKNDTVPQLAQTIFTIDQINGRIYNKEPLPFGSKFNVIGLTVYPDQSSKVYVETSDGSTEEIKAVSREHKPDTVAVSNGKVRLLVKSLKEDLVARYELTINTYTSDPDTIEWKMTDNFLPANIGHRITNIVLMDGHLFFLSENAGAVSVFQSSDRFPFDWVSKPVSSLTSFPSYNKIFVYNDKLITLSNEKLMSSSDGVSWSLIDAPYTPLSLIGVLPKTTHTDYALCMIVRKDGKLHFATWSEGRWREGDEVPSTFAIRNYASDTYVARFMPGMFLTQGETGDGIHTSETWYTNDGLKWASMGDVSQRMIPPLKSASLVKYGDFHFLIGGLDRDGDFSTQIYYTQNYGFAWYKDTGKRALPSTIKPILSPSLWVDKDHYIYLMGGYDTDGKVNRRVIRGRMNIFSFTPID